MLERNIVLIAYYLAALFDNGGVENGHMVNFLRRLNQEEPIGEGARLTEETDRLSKGIQSYLRRKECIEPVPGMRSGGPAGDRGWWRLTNRGRNEAKTLLDRIITEDIQE